MVHQNMVPYRPDVHCSHIGPSGGGYCGDDKSYGDTVTEEYFTNYPFVGGGRKDHHSKHHGKKNGSGV